MKKRELAESLLPITLEACHAILEIYNKGVDSSLKQDGSPVTKADLAAERILSKGIEKVAPSIPIVSEENTSSHTLRNADRFFLVDPLDGTKEFLKPDNKGAYTINIGLIEHGVPTLGVLCAPALDQIFVGIENLGAFEFETNRCMSLADGNPICTRPRQTNVKALISVSHLDRETEDWLTDHEITHTEALGSSLKFARLAAGHADLYPRFGPTMEWDTAAGDAILRAAGGCMVQMDGAPFLYGKSGYKNGAFIASGKEFLDERE